MYTLQVRFICVVAVWITVFARFDRCLNLFQPITKHCSTEATLFCFISRALKGPLIYICCMYLYMLYVFIYVVCIYICCMYLYMLYVFIYVVYIYICCSIYICCMYLYMLCVIYICCMYLYILYVFICCMYLYMLCNVPRYNTTSAKSELEWRTIY